MAYLVFGLRLGIGALLLIAGALKAHDGPAATAATIAGYRLLPAGPVAVLGVALPYLEVLLGAYVAMGLFTRASAWIATVQFGIFAAAVASLVVRRIPADCGCFGSALRTPPTWGHVSADVALAFGAAFIALGAPGAFAVDRLLGLGGTLEPVREG
jgi:uncharacterized membrane protein YphA (DoxX/SURF4 family)